MNTQNENKPLIVQSSANGATLTDVLGTCCYGGNRTRKDCGDCAAWRVLGKPADGCYDCFIGAACIHTLNVPNVKLTGSL